LTSYLEKNGVQGEGEVDLSQFSHGQSNPTFVLKETKSRRKLVLRKQPPGKLLRGAHAVDREYKVMTLIKEHLPVPKTVHYCADPEIIGTPFFLYEYVSGDFYTDLGQMHAIVENKGARRRIFDNMLDTLAQVHSVDVDAVGLADFGRRYDGGNATGASNPHVLRQVGTWTKQYRATETETIQEMDWLCAELADALPTDAERVSTLVHGDFRLDNVIISPDANRKVLAILDWELATLGDPLTDIGTNLMVYFLDAKNPFLRGLAGLDVAQMGLPSYEEAIAHYATCLDARAGSKLPPVSEANVDYYVAFSLFRSCAILQGVYKRSLMGNASAANAGAALAFAKETAALGAEQLRKFHTSFGKVRDPTTAFSSATTTGGSKRAFSSYAYTSAAGMRRRTSTGARDHRGTLTCMQHSNVFPTSVLWSSSRFAHSAAGMDVTSQDGPTRCRAASRRVPDLSRGSMSPRALDMLQGLEDFMQSRVLPRESEILEHAYETPGAQRWQVHPAMEELKAQARTCGLWNLFLPLESDPTGQHGAGLTNLEYAPMAEVMGGSLVAPEVFNCNAPDTGNMEVLLRYGTPEQQAQWLPRLLNGEIRSCFAMTEPDVASSDATNMQASVEEEGDSVVLHGRKWWTSGALDPRCELAIFMGVSQSQVSVDAPRHQRHSMVLVPLPHPQVCLTGLKLETQRNCLLFLLLHLLYFFFLNRTLPFCSVLCAFCIYRYACCDLCV
jgi:acyl-CoA dehydrogenase family protein 10